MTDAAPLTAAVLRDLSERLDRLTSRLTTAERERLGPEIQKAVQAVMRLLPNVGSVAAARTREGVELVVKAGGVRFPLTLEPEAAVELLDQVAEAIGISDDARH